MKNKGFTLVELLAVLIIIGILFGIGVSAVFDVINKSKETVGQNQINTILNAAYDYSLKNLYNLPNTGNSIEITLAELKHENYIDYNIIDPITNEAYSDDLLIEITNISNNRNIERDKSISKIKGDYLYKIKENIVDSNFYVNCGSNLDIQIGDEFSDTDCEIKYGGVNITPDKTIINYSKNNDIVSIIDTDEYAIYNISYTIEYTGKVITTSKKVTVIDTQSPILVDSDSIEINSFEIEIISLNDPSFDLMDGIHCTDNSISCEVIVEGNIAYDKIGTYVIKYYAKDSAGNTSESILRTIKVE